MFGTTATTLNAMVTALYNGGEFFGLASGLQAHTTYYYKVFASDGTTALPGGTGSFTTTGLTSGMTYKDGIVTAFDIVNRKQLEVTISGKVSAIPPGGLQLLVDTKGNGTFDVTKILSVNADKTFKFALTGLLPAHMYSVVVTATGDSSTRYTNVEPFTTLFVSVAPYVSALADTTATITANISDGSASPTVFYGVDLPHMTGKAVLSKDASGTYSAKLTINGVSTDISERRPRSRSSPTHKRAARPA